MSLNLISHTLDKYRILEEIGRGGMAVVYKALDTTLGRTVALKVLPPHFTFDPAFVRRFQREARTAAGLDHPNIVTVYEVGEQDGLHYIAMQYLEGGTLQRVIKREGALRPERAAQIAQQVAGALDHAHTRGVIHRDVKPSNVLFTTDGRAVLGDFGIAWSVEGTRLTQTGVSVGTPEYMAPEQVQGRAASERTDIYALGVVCYEMLTGRVPFQGNTTAVLHAHVYEAPPRPRALNPNIPAQIERAVLTALAKQPRERYESAGALAQAVAAPVATEPPTVVTLPGRAVEGRGFSIPLWLPVAGALSLLLLLATILMALSGRTSGAGPSTPSPMQGAASKVQTLGSLATSTRMPSPTTSLPGMIVAPEPTATSVPPTATPRLPTATSVLPIPTSVPPTTTPVPSTATPRLPTATHTRITTPEAQQVAWGPVYGRDPGICVNGCAKFIPWAELKEELHRQLLPYISGIPTGCAVALKDYMGKRDWIVQIVDPSGNEIGHVWLGPDPDNDWVFDGRVRVGSPGAPAVVWAIFQRYSDGTYRRLSTVTPMPSTATTRPISTATPTPDASKGIRVGEPVVVVYREEDGISQRRTPGYRGKPSNDVIANWYLGAQLMVTDGPRTADGLRWWQVSGEGWMAEISAKGTRLISGPVTAGQRVRVVYSGEDGVALRRTPGFGGQPDTDELADAYRGAELTVVNGPANADGLIWWKLSAEGWMAEVASTGTRLIEAR